jgi:hypothetical protein
MPRKSFTPEEIISKLREAEVLLSQGEPLDAVCRGLGISEQTYYRWRLITGFSCRHSRRKTVIQNMAGCALIRHTV